jgi:hypothetical protein
MSLSDGVLAGELFHDGVGKRVGDHRHMAGGMAQSCIRPHGIARGLGVDHVFQRQHVRLDQIGHDMLREIGVGRAQEGPEVLGTPHQLSNSLVLLGFLLSSDALRILHDEADMLAPQRQKRLLGVRTLGRADGLGQVDGVGIQRACGRLKLGTSLSHGSSRRGSSQNDVFAQ